MLEKMGWSKGKGLGANLDGSLNFIKVAHKDNQKGMGFKDRDDQWTQHEDNFNALLKSFETAGGAAAAANDDAAAADSSEESNGRGGFGFKSAEPEPTKELHFSGVSLEEQSKKSRSRVHYKKFTRGKDMARYSGQDLANIFGKRSLGDKHAHAVEAEEVIAQKEQDEASPVETEEKTFGVTVIKTGLSVADYFKAKMEALQAKRKGPDGAKSASNPFYVYQPEKVTLNFTAEEGLDGVVGDNGAGEKVSKKKRKREAAAEDEEPTDLPLKKEKKSKKKSKASDEEVVALIEHIVQNPNAEETVAKSKKKSKKTAAEEIIPDEIADVPLVADTEKSEIKKSKKKSKKSKLVELNQEPPTVDLTAEQATPERKLKKKRRISVEEVPLTSASNDIDSTDDVVRTKKAKKSKKNKRRDDEVENEPILIADQDAINDAPPTPSQSKSREVIKTQPLHFPKFVSNILTSLYDPPITDVNQSELVAAGQTSAVSTPPPPPPAPLSAACPPTSQSHQSSSTILEETFELAKYKAEVFRFFDMDGFAGSSLGDLVGYGYSRNLQLKVITAQRDDARITNFWDLALVNKYGADVIKIRKVAKKKKYNIKALEKKNVFKF